MPGIDAIRNVSFVGHPSSGKTTLVDALAHILGASSRKGSVVDKTSICDTEPEEQEKQHTLQMAVVHATGKERSWNLFDTPGYPEFVAEVQSAMFGSDLIVGVVSCASGVTHNLRTKMEQAKAMGRGRAVVLTHLDGDNSDFETTVRELRSKVGEQCVPVEIPDASGPSFSAVTPSLENPESEWCQRLKDRVMDACEDEELLMEYLESQELPADRLDELLHAAIAKGALIPVLVCNPDSGLLAEEVADFLARFAPSPLDRPTTDSDGEVIELDPSAPLSATVLNVQTDPHVGKICLVRVHAGTLHAADAVVPPEGDKGEKLGGLFHLVGKTRENVESAGPGEIVAFSKVERIPVWSGVTTAGAQARIVPTPEPPTPMVALAVTPKSRADEQKIGEALSKLDAEDPTFQIEHSKDTHELVVHGMSDLHLTVILARMKRRYGVEVETALPRIAYRETITKPAEGHHRHKKQSGGRGQFGECYLRLRPLETGEGIQFKDSVVGGAIPRNLIPAVEKGIREITSEGILTLGEVVDVEAEVHDGKFHAVDSDEASFKLAGSRAFRDGFERAGPVLLEPVMELEIHVPTDHAGTVFSDITSHRRGQVLDQANEADGAVTVIKAEAPLQTIQTYHRDLKSQTAGEGSYSMRFARYAPVPATEQPKVLAQYGRKHEED